jgi:hypothetical protein
LGHYDDCYAADEERARLNRERQVASEYEKLLGQEALTEDKLKDALIYILKCQYDRGSLPTLADIHLRRLRGDQGFER